MAALPTEVTSETPDIQTAFNASIRSLTIEKVLYAVIALVLCIIVQKIIMRLLKRTFQYSHIGESLHTFVRSTVQIILYIITLLIVADSIGFPVSTLIAMFSVVGLAISLAVQDSLSNLAGGILVLTAKPFVVGDIIAVGLIGGKVQEIGLFYTKLTTSDNKTAFMPNRMLSSSNTVNYTAAGLRRLDISITTPAAYDAQVVRDAFLSMANSSLYAESGHMPVIRMIARGPGTTEYLFQLWVDTAEYWNTYFDIVENAADALRRHGISSEEDMGQNLTIHIIENPQIGA